MRNAKFSIVHLLFLQHCKNTQGKRLRGNAVYHVLIDSGFMVIFIFFILLYFKFYVINIFTFITRKTTNDIKI